MKSKHKCECFDGYQLEVDGFTCKRNDSVTPYIIFSNRHELRGIDLHTHNVKVRQNPEYFSILSPLVLFYPIIGLLLLLLLFIFRSFSV